ADRGWQILAGQLRQLGLGVEQLELGRTAGHEQENDPLGPRLEVTPRQGSGRGRGGRVLVEQRGQGDGADAPAGGVEGLAARQGLVAFQREVHGVPLTAGTYGVFLAACSGKSRSYRRSNSSTPPFSR